MPCSASRFCLGIACRPKRRPDHTMMKESEQERFWDGGSAPKPPRFIALRQDSWSERASCARPLGIPAPESALGLRLRRALPSAQVRSVYQGQHGKKNLAVYTKHLTHPSLSAAHGIVFGLFDDPRHCCKRIFFPGRLLRNDGDRSARNSKLNPLAAPKTSLPPQGVWHNDGLVVESKSHG